MREGIAALSERGKEALRLLLCGHDAKSIARELGLSVHTVNERLRDARRKLGVSSSREAARLLAEAEHAESNSFADKQLRVGGRVLEAEDQRRGRVRLAWLGGGMLTMLALIIAGAAVWSASVGNNGTEVHAASAVTQAAVASTPADQVALKWLQLWDRQRWAECWREAGAQVKSAISEAGFASTAQHSRELVGPVSSRRLVTVTAFGSAPGLAQGDYVNVVFRADFARKKGAVETVTLSREGSDWTVIGHHIR